jgi:hypothetical protein
MKQKNMRATTYKGISLNEAQERAVRLMMAPGVVVMPGRFLGNCTRYCVNGRGPSITAATLWALHRRGIVQVIYHPLPEYGPDAKEARFILNR